MWSKILKYFKDSEVILWARLQMVVGALWLGLSQTDLSPIISGKYLTYWLILNGVVTELLRRTRAETNPDGTLK